MPGPTPDGFYTLTPTADTFQLTVGLLTTLPNGLKGLEGNDLIRGSSDAELIHGNLGNDSIFGEVGNDQLLGGKDADFLTGELGNDDLSGNQGNDVLSGDEGNDTLQGGKGDDILIGVAGQDFLIGDAGSDTLSGGSGDDVFVLNQLTPEIDIISDFGIGVDRIGLQGNFTLADINLEADGGNTLIELRDSGATLAIVSGILPSQIRDHIFSLDTPAGNFFNPSVISTTPLTPSPVRITLETLPQPNATPSTANPATVIPIPDNPVLAVPSGFSVNVFAENLNRPRWMAVTPTGDVLVTETPSNQIRLLQDSDQDGTVDRSEIFAGPENGLNQPFGMVFTNNFFYVGNTDSIVRFPYQPGQTQILGTGEIIADLPAGGHWTRNLALSPDGEKLYVSIGSLSNVDPEPLPRASVQVMNLDGSNQETFASGLRNPVGLDFHPQTGQLYTTVNERDRLGDDLVPDYLTGLEAGDFYGWPYAYLSPNQPDPRRQGERPDLVALTQTPDVLFQAHSAALGLQFYDGETFPEAYQNGAFVAFRGSWNRSVQTGYKVVFVPFDANGQPLGTYQDFLTGFLQPEQQTTWGRPTGLQTLPDGSLLITEEENNRIYRVQYNAG